MVSRHNYLRVRLVHQTWQRPPSQTLLASSDELVKNKVKLWRRMVNITSPAQLGSAHTAPTTVTMPKKIKKSKKKAAAAAKKLSPEEEKQLMISVLMVKCNMPEDELLKAYDDFYTDYPDGVISKEKYIASIKVLMIN